MLYIDMDEVLADFSGSVAKSRGISIEEAKKIWAPEEMYKDGFFENLDVIEGAREVVTNLIGLFGIDNVAILTQPLVDNPNSYAEKARWTKKHFPELEYKIIMTQNKSLIKSGILIDDNKKWDTGVHHFVHFDAPDRESRLNEWKLVQLYLQLYKMGAIDDNN